jgi:hypothetical protein
MFEYANLHKMLHKAFLWLDGPSCEFITMVAPMSNSHPKSTLKMLIRKASSPVVALLGFHGDKFHCTAGVVVELHWAHPR